MRDILYIKDPDVTLNWSIDRGTEWVYPLRTQSIKETLLIGLAEGSFLYRRGFWTKLRSFLAEEAIFGCIFGRGKKGIFEDLKNFYLWDLSNIS